MSLVWLAQAQPGLLDAARATRERLLQSEPGARLVDLYYAVGHSGTVQAALAKDPSLQWQCLLLTKEISALACKLPSGADLSSALAGSLREPVPGAPPNSLADSVRILATRADGLLSVLAGKSPIDEARLLQEASSIIQNWGRNA